VSAFLVILVVLAIVVVVLMAGGYVAMARRTGAREHKLLEQLHRAERELARAHAADKGWDPAIVEAAARAAAEQRFGAASVTSLQLVQVVDKPGTDADQAVFRVQTADGEHAITLGRSGGVWGPA
jgi:type II secretory pathway pseudopilin PulG